MGVNFASVFHAVLDRSRGQECIEAFEAVFGPHIDRRQGQNRRLNRRAGQAKASVPEKKHVAPGGRSALRRSKRYFPVKLTVLLFAP